MTKTAIIFTGGTIAMEESKEDGLARPALSGNELLETAGICSDEVAVEEFGNYPSPHLDFKKMFDIFKKIEVLSKDSNINGIVVAHGTDILEETAFFVDCLYGGVKPVVFTGAMKNKSQKGYDGYTNLSNAILVAKNKKSRGYGVLVAMAGEIHAARDVTKTHTSKIETFKSPGKGPLGVVDYDKVIYHRNLKRVISVRPKKVNAKVSLIKTVSGMNSDFVHYSIRNNYQGIVIEAMGRGNIPPEVAEKLKEAMKLNLVVVVTSRCHEGRVSPDYGYEGGAYDLKKAGAILAGDMSGIKARIRLTTALSAGLDKNAIEAIIQEDVN
ncbi:MAG: asparaginase [Clostridia bacterium]